MTASHARTSVVALALPLALSSCTREGDTNIFLSNSAPPTVTGSSPSPTPGGSQCPTIPRMRVSFYGIRGCSNPPQNGAGILPLDCVGDATATPFGPDGDPLPATVHGFNVTWATTSLGAGRVRVIESSDNPFNRVVIPDSLGEVTVTAVLTPPGCTGQVTGSFSFRVIASGARASRLFQDAGVFGGDR